MEVECHGFAGLGLEGLLELVFKAAGGEVDVDGLDACEWDFLGLPEFGPLSFRGFGCVGGLGLLVWLLLVLVLLRESAVIEEEFVLGLDEVAAGGALDVLLEFFEFGGVEVGRGSFAEGAVEVVVGVADASGVEAGFGAVDFGSGFAFEFALVG